MWEGVERGFCGKEGGGGIPGRCCQLLTRQSASAKQGGGIAGFQDSLPPPHLGMICCLTLLACPLPFLKSGTMA